MNTRKIREDLGRVRTCVQRRDYPRAVYLFCNGLRELGGQTAPMVVRGDIRTALADLCGDPVYKKKNVHALSYQPGNEKELLAFFSRFYSALSGEEKEEDYEATLARKVNLDRCINDGKVFLGQGKPSDADNCFAEAFKYYKDEIAVYGLMAKAMMDAKEYVRALGYIRKGLNEKADNADLRQLAEECLKKRAQAGR